MALVGYARVSSTGQSPEVQLDKLKDCKKILQEKRSAAIAGKRPQLEACLEYVREDDTLVVTRLDRLARSMLHLCQIGDELKRKGVELRVTDQNIDTADTTGRLLFNMPGAIAQFETEIRAERQRDGITKAKKKGIKFSAQRKLASKQIKELKRKREAGALIKPLMNYYRLSKASVYRYLEKSYEQPNSECGNTFIDG